MNKQAFIEELRKRLNILSETEVNDIINEYSDVIVQKVQDGKSEEEAVADFGSINELVDGILEAYKINPNRKPNGFEKDILNILDQVISKASDFFQSLFHEISSEGVARFLIYGIIIFIALIALRIPFAIVEGLMRSLFFFSTGFTFVSTLIGLFLSFAYMACCIIIIASIIKSLQKGNSPTNNPRKTYQSTHADDAKAFEARGETTHTPPIKESQPKVNKPSNYDDYKKTNSSFLNIITNIFKVIVVMLMIPIWICFFLGCIAVGIGTFFLFQGINISGPILLVIGILGFIGGFACFIHRLVFHPTIKSTLHKFVISLCVSAVFIVIGLSLSVNTIFNGNTAYITQQNFTKHLKTQSTTYQFSSTEDLRVCFGDADISINERLLNQDSIEAHITTPTFLSAHLNSSEVNYRINPVNLLRNIAELLADNVGVTFDDIDELVKIDIYLPYSIKNDYKIKNNCLIID